MIYNGGVSAIVGGQFGSEAKGLAASWLAINHSASAMFCLTNAGAQAGHTTVLEDDTTFVCYHLPTIGVLNPDSLMYLTAGSIIDLDLLAKEVCNISAAISLSVSSLLHRLVIHPNAAVITHQNKMDEAGLKGTTHLGSTGKGVGAALASKVMRRPEATISAHKGLINDLLSGVIIGTLDIPGLLDDQHPVTLEVPQGTGLGINNPGDFYPKSTSRDCWVMQGLTDAGIHAHYLSVVLMVCRTFPIRVGHVYDPERNIIGHSGDFYPDSPELKWEDFPGVQPEITTVTKRVRRIADWSNLQYKVALKLNRPTHVMLTFVNYLRTAADLWYRIQEMKKVEHGLGMGYIIHIYSWGPRPCDCSHDPHEAAKHTAAGVG